jgi:putative peptidoglycan lipid II flippase
MSLNRGFFTFGGWTLLSRVVGFVRDMMIAAVMGAGPLADAFVVAQRLPNLFRTLFAEGALAAAFVPLFTRTRAEGGDDAARTFAAEANAVLLTALLFFCGIMILAMPWVIRFIAPGFADEPLRFGVAVSLAQITFPYLFFISLTSLQGGVLNALGRLGAYGAAPVLYNIIQIIAILYVVPLAGTMNTDVGHILAWSTTVAGVGQWLLLMYFCHRAGFPVRWRLPHLSEGVKTFLRRLAPGAIGAGANQINLVVSTMLASLLPTGAVAYLYYADRLYQLPLGVIGIAVSTALLPVITQALHDGDDKKITDSFSRAIDLGMAFGLPAAVGLAVLAPDIYHVLFVRGAFTAADAAMSAAILVGYVAGIPGFILVRLCATRFFAMHDTRTPVRAAGVAMATNIALAVWLLPLLGALGIAMAISAAVWANFFVLRWRLKQQNAFTIDDICRRRALMLTAAAVLMGALTAGVAAALHPLIVSGALVLQLAALAVELVAGALVYAALIILTRALPVADAMALLKRRRTKPDKAQEGNNVYSD